jgi:hypothetical protein
METAHNSTGSEVIVAPPEVATPERSPRGKLRGHIAIPHSLDSVVHDTFRLWRKHHLGYDQTKYIVEQIRRRLGLKPPRMRNRTVARLEREVQRLIQTTYRSQSKYGLVIKTLFQSGARMAEFVHIRVEDLLLDGDPPQIHIIRRSTSSVPNGGPIATCRSYRRWQTNCALISRRAKPGSCLRATGTHANSGIAYVGNIGGEGTMDFTALGDVVNTASRMQSAAMVGEVVLSEPVYAQVADEFPDVQSRALNLRGKEASVTARVLKV